MYTNTLKRPPAHSTDNSTTRPLSWTVVGLLSNSVAGGSVVERFLHILLYNSMLTIQVEDVA